MPMGESTIEAPLPNSQTVNTIYISTITRDLKKDHEKEKRIRAYTSRTSIRSRQRIGSQAETEKWNADIGSRCVFEISWGIRELGQ